MHIAVERPTGKIKSSEENGLARSGLSLTEGEIFVSEESPDENACEADTFRYAGGCIEIFGERQVDRRIDG